MADYIFGYGSIINDDSRFSTLQSGSQKRPNTHIEYGQAGNFSEDLAVCAHLSHKYAHRHWNYRCATGFTALGVELVKEKTSAAIDVTIDNDFMNGVVYPVSAEQLKSFDVREVGYYRASIPLEMIRIDLESGCDAAKRRAAHLHEQLCTISSKARDQTPTSLINIWIYVPESNQCAYPDEDYPILQTYVDVCLRGCLQWGGVVLAQHFLRTTFGWSDCFLNDAPLSRRPWLHRLNYTDIDACLGKCAEHVKFECRRHPEEFAAMHGSALKGGMWGLPSRNKLFIGREHFMSLIYDKLNDVSDGGGMRSGGVCVADVVTDGALAVSSTSSAAISIRQVEVVGMGGVGKSQVSVEYAHRHYGSSYGFVAFIRSESTASIAADLRRLAYDMGILTAADSSKKSVSEGAPLKSNVRNASGDSSGGGNGSRVMREDMPLDDEAIAEEIKRRLARCRYRWLLIFDNVEDPDCVVHYLPRGLEISSNGGGHVLVTSRIAHAAWVSRGSALMLSCFGSEESVRFLNMALKARTGSIGGEEEGKRGSGVIPAQHTSTSDKDLKVLASRMGHLPLALWTAGVYMSKCDISSTEYIHRFDTIVTQSMHTGQSSSDAIAACFNMTLDKIISECQGSSNVLLCLGYLAPDISKRMVKLLLCAQSVTRSARATPLIKSSESMKSRVVFSCPNDRDLAKKKLDSMESRVDYMVCGVLVCGTAVAIQARSVFSLLDDVSSRDVEVFVFGVSVGCMVTLIGVIALLLKSNKQQHNEMAGCDFTETHEPVLAGVNSTSGHTSSDSSTASTLNPPLPTSLSSCSDLLSCHQMSCSADQLWDMMRQFSLLSGLRGPFDDSRVGTVHRLQQAVLRARAASRPEGSVVDNEGAEYAVTCMERCVWLLFVLWCFDASDAQTWDAAGDVLEHVQTLSKHVLDHIYASGSRCGKSQKLSRENTLLFASLLTSGGEYASIVLSRFDTAQSLLETACVVHVYILHPENLMDRQKHISFDAISTAAVNDIMLEDERFRCLQNVGDTLHMLGKTLRYNGHLTQAERCLKKALRVRKSSVVVSAVTARHDSPTTADDTSGKEDSLTTIKISETMYELGVLYLRMHSLYTAKSYFTLALELVCKFKLAIDVHVSLSCCMSKEARSITLRVRSCEAAALHQLGVVATLERRYEDAEGHLLSALDVMSSRVSGSGGMEQNKASITRAATLQQLGKVELRRGNLVKAHDHLISALGIYRQAYGEQRCASHVNVAAVYHHLGSTAMASKQFESACEYFSDALTARENVAEESSIGAMEVIQAVQSLAQAEMECGRFDAAEELFLRAKGCLEKELKLLQDGNTHTPQQPDSPTKEHPSSATPVDSSNTESISVIGEKSSLYESLIKNLFFCAHSLRGIYTRKERPDLAAMMTKEVRALKAIHTEKSGRPSTGKKKKETKKNASNTSHPDQGVLFAEQADGSTLLITVDIDVPVRVASKVALEGMCIGILSDLLCTRHVVRTHSRCLQTTLKTCTAAKQVTPEAFAVIHKTVLSITTSVESFTAQYADSSNRECGESSALRLLQVALAFASSVNITANTLQSHLTAMMNDGAGRFDSEGNNILTVACSDAAVENVLVDVCTCCKELFNSSDRVRGYLKDLDIHVDDVT
jgi:tetratricopeptide (TPR) repeat protein